MFLEHTIYIPFERKENKYNKIFVPYFWFDQRVSCLSHITFYKFCHAVHYVCEYDLARVVSTSTSLLSRAAKRKYNKAPLVRGTIGLKVGLQPNTI